MVYKLLFEHSNTHKKLCYPTRARPYHLQYNWVTIMQSPLTQCCVKCKSFTKEGISSKSALMLLKVY